METSIQNAGYTVKRKPKAPGDHLYDYEIQWMMQKVAPHSNTTHKHTVTFGITEWSNKASKRILEELYGYVRCPEALLPKVQTMIAAAEKQV